MPFSYAGKKDQDKNSNMFIENVKILDCSDLSISEVSDRPKKPNKKMNNKQGQMGRQSLGSQNGLNKSILLSQQF